MKQLNILVDMDEVLVDLLPTWIGCLNLQFGTNVDYRDISSWDICQYFPGSTEEQTWEVLGSESFWRLIEPKEGAVDYLQILLAQGHRVFVVTASHYDTVAAKIRGALIRHFPFIHWENIIITAHKQMIRGDVLVDDGIHNLIGGDYAKILMDMPHNQGIDAERYGVVRAKNWVDVCVEICRISNSIEKGGEKEMTIQTNTYLQPVKPITPVVAAHKEGGQKKSVTLFTTGCPKCTVLKQKLDTKGVLYAVNTSKEQMEKLGITQVPVLKVDETLLTFAEANDWVNQQKG